MQNVRLYLAQRISAMVMGPLVLGHLAIMIYAVQDGLSAGEILSRTQGSVWWTCFYGLFVLAVSVHASIGIRVILSETVGLSRSVLNILTPLIAIGLIVFGGRAVYAVVA